MTYYHIIDQLGFIRIKILGGDREFIFFLLFSILPFDFR